MDHHVTFGKTTAAQKYPSVGSTEELTRAFEQRFPRPWAEKHIRSEKGEALDFADRPWLKTIYDDLHPRIVVQKAAQVGLTTCALVWSLHMAAVQKKTVIYTLPNEGVIDDFVAGRVDSVIDNSPYLSKLSGRSPRGKTSPKRIADNRGLKRLAGGSIYFRGTQTVQGAISLTADALINDELDHSQPEVLELFLHRLDALPPADRKILQFSTPTVAGYGVSAAYEASDAREWLVRCTHCSWQGSLDYVLHTGGELNYLRCSKCEGKLDPRNGEWVPAHPGRDVHGYWVPRLLLALPERPDLLEALHKRHAEAHYAHIFHNMDLGVPSEEGVDRIKREEILASCFTESYEMASAVELGTGPYYMGIDQGNTLTIAIGRADPRMDQGRLRLVYLDRIHDPMGGSAAWDQVAELIGRFNIRLCVVDALPNSANAHDLAHRFPGCVLLSYYSGTQRTEFSEAASVLRRAQQAPVWPPVSIGAADRVDISLDRTQSLDQTAAYLREGKFLLPGPVSHHEVEALIVHCVNNVRRLEVAADDTPVHRWHKTGPNDYLHALNYLRVAFLESARLAQLNPVIVAPVVVLGVNWGSNWRKRQRVWPFS